MKYKIALLVAVVLSTPALAKPLPVSRVDADIVAACGDTRRVRPAHVRTKPASSAFASVDAMMAEMRSRHR